MPSVIGVYWATYVLIGYVMLDFSPQAGGMFLMIAGIVGGLFSGWVGNRQALRRGELDRQQGRREALHWASLFVAITAVIVLSLIQHVRGNVVGQYVTLMVGIVYFLAGVHYDRKFIWLGLLMIVGTIGISFLPRFGWSALGILMAGGLLVASFLNRNSESPPAQSRDAIENSVATKNPAATENSSTQNHA
jgi:hypothetical protein